MSDEEESPGDLRAKAAIAVAKHAVEHALLGGEERAKDDALSRKKRNKRIVYGVIGALVVVGAIGLMLNYWYWALLLGLIGAAGLYARRRWRARRASKKKPAAAAPPKETKALAPRVRIQPEPTRVAPEPDTSIDEDLAELKARLKR